MRTLTKQEIERQDFTDDKIFELIQELLPENSPFKWDIEVIGTVRDEIRMQVVEEKQLMTEQEFYPYIKT